ncbi:MAG: universal stress protein [Anaerolineae bacterium]
MFKNILVAYDGSDCANQAAQTAGEIASKFGGEILILYAFHPIPRHWGDTLREKAVSEEITQGNLLVNNVVDRLRAAGVHVEGQVVEGMPHEAIAKMARRRNIDLIVIGSNGMGETASYLLGSVSDKVVHRAACSVLVVR